MKIRKFKKDTVKNQIKIIKWLLDNIPDQSWCTCFENDDNEFENKIKEWSWENNILHHGWIVSRNALYWREFDFKNWSDYNSDDKYLCCCFKFENASDAILFKLRWA
jgi:hypothetical protein